MKISITPRINNSHNYPNFKAEIFDINEAYFKNKKSNNELPVTPSHTIFSLKEVLQLGKNAFYCIKSEKENVSVHIADAKKYLSDNDGKVHFSTLKQFAALYLNLLSGARKKVQEELEYYNAILDGTFSAVYLGCLGQNPADKAYIFLGNDSSDDDKLARNNLTMLPAEERKELAKQLICYAEDCMSQLPDMIYKRTLRLFQLSRTENGFDLSLIDKKNKIADDTEWIHDNYDYNFDEVFAFLTGENFKKDGVLDIDKANLFFDFIKSIQVKLPVKYVFDIFERYTSKDKNHQKEITACMKELNDSVYSMHQEGCDFEDLMDLCFKENGKFSPKRSYILLDAVDSTNTWIGNMQTNNFVFLKADTGIIASINYRNASFVKMVIQEYFETCIDDDGNLCRNILFEDFFNEHIKNITFLI